ncbi:flagellar hook-associated protein FlgK [Cellulomonas fimi]|uniref:Flagellar hook-associated protein 1 n=1 Tax=Cellulomonas fimi (strain ATCC 484 / DSM 20113 / JCM 1341 / CCUG 24087 / LMG 16345 / NBRC 15513 / NCIMB 8980 / NCTC 7547 / NRS-133) TaxID=590998 RepID=F4GYT2_CELFA|nr:flagellar hook-associated protein FlgK [Cellulomonas fimi]AEE44801.1 flagellar hook-associated protein FlgK [Cellulomonas fimi ATCC 484]NNH08383.1 flagellar hook-associated protein FlgK [Cellulomonas fimi]VEH27330.1 Flagellar hook-associated protein 1 [Cellulomonas fimi]
MSTFSGLGTALSSLIAQRQALDVAGQNVANANTVGYTRQRASMSALPAAQVPSMFSVNHGAGEGVRVTGIERLGDVFLDMRLRTQTGGASYLAARADAYATLEKSLGEPGETGLASQLATMWGAWADLSNTPDKDSARAVVMQESTAVADRIATLYTAARTQWTQALSTTTALVDKVNTTAAGVADLNARILEITNSGGTANELADQRDLLVMDLASLVGASAVTRENGQVDVLVGGNALVSGKRAHALEVQGARSFAQATGDTATPGQPVTVVWAERPTQSAGLDGGRVAGLLSVLAPAGPGGTGGPLVEAAARYDALAQTIATKVNAFHSTAVTTTGAAGGDFWAVDGPEPPALALRIAVADRSAIAVAAAGAGALDGSVGDQIAALKTDETGPDAHWSATVVDLGVRAASASARSKVAESARVTAQQQQLAATSVDTDEETVNMLAFQRAYEGAARVLTAVDEMLDTLINRTGLVGR